MSRKLCQLPVDESTAAPLHIGSMLYSVAEGLAGEEVDNGFSPVMYSSYNVGVLW